MRVEAIHGRPSLLQAWGAAAELAEARRLHQAQFPHVSWSTVMTEAQKVRAEKGITLAQALYVVFERLSSGAWQPASAA
jgi:hypothetical protein